MPLTDWGQDWDEWNATRPKYDANGHQLGYDPAVHKEGKGFILSNGAVWTWPTHKMRPQHMEYNYRVQRQHLSPHPSLSPFHILGDSVYVYGPGRKVTPELQEVIQAADPRLKFDEPLNIPDVPNFGHGHSVLDILDEHDRKKKMGLSCTKTTKVGDLIKCADCGRTLRWLHFAFNYKKLRREPYFKTPEGRAALEMLERRYPRDPRVLNWLLREYRRGRLTVSPQWQEHTNGLMNAERSEDPDAIQHWNSVLDDPHRPDVVLWHPNPEGGYPSPVQPGIVQGIGQMMDRGVGGKGVDIMKHTFGDFMPIYEQWNSERRQRDPNAGEVVHQFPNGWSMRRLTNPDEAYDEGEAMQNCVPKFAPGISSGDVHIFSLRDPKNAPHANVLMQPGQDGHWASGHVRDIRGKQNARPNPEYQQMVRQWFDTFDPKPGVQWDQAPGPVNDQGPGEPDEYGLNYMNRYGNTSGWDFESEWDGFRVEANFNKVRNMLRKNNQLTAKNQLANEFFRNYFGTDWERDPANTDEYDPNRWVGTPHNRADPYAEWLHREFRKGRLNMPINDYEYYLNYVQQMLDRIKENHPENEELAKVALTPEALRDLQEQGPLYQQLKEIDPHETNDMRSYAGYAIENYDSLMKNPGNGGFKPYVVDEDGNSMKMDPEITDVLPKVLQRRSDKGEQANIMKLTAPELMKEAREEAMLQRLLKHGGITEHEYPNGWSLRRVNDPEAATLEGELMGHCIGGYGDQIANGSSLNYSLRDERGFPHMTFELKPTRPHRYDPEQAEADPEVNTLLGAGGGLTNPPDFNTMNEYMEQDRNGNIDRYNMDPDHFHALQEFKKLGIKNGWLSPNPEGADAYQVQGKQNVAPDPKYHPYIREWADTFPYEDRPKSSWRSYFQPQDAMYPEQLPEVEKKVDEFGFQAPNRSVNWNAMVKGLNGQGLQWANPHSQSKKIGEPMLPEDGYDPRLGQQVYEHARNNGQLVPLYKAVNDLGTKAPPTDISELPCPSCGAVGRLRQDYYTNGQTYCSSCGEETPNERINAQLMQQPAGNMTPYTGQMTSHLGGLFAQHPELQNYAMHDAPNVAEFKCPNCGGQIGKCNACPGDDHGICTQCGAYVPYPGANTNPFGQAQASWHFGGSDCPHLKYQHIWPTGHVSPTGNECHCLWNSASDSSKTANWNFDAAQAS